MSSLIKAKTVDLGFIVSVYAQLMVHDTVTQQWQPAENGETLGSTCVFLTHCRKGNTFAISGGYDKDSLFGTKITKEFRYELSRDDSLFAWHDSQAHWGLDWGKKSPETECFVKSVDQVLKVLSLNLTLEQQEKDYPFNYKSSVCYYSRR